MMMDFWEGNQNTVTSACTLRVMDQHHVARNAVMSLIVRCRQSAIKKIFLLGSKLSLNPTLKIPFLWCIEGRALEIICLKTKIYIESSMFPEPNARSVEQRRCRKADGLVSAKHGCFIRKLTPLCEKATNSVQLVVPSPEINCSIACRPPKCEHGTVRREFGVVLTSDVFVGCSVNGECIPLGNTLHCHWFTLWCVL